jgi:hypothetical protein
MQVRRRSAIAAGGAALALVAAGAVGAAVAGGAGDRRAQGSAAEQAEAAALAHTGGGRVVGVEQENEGAEAFEVEVVTRAGHTVEVSLSTDNSVLSSERDDEDGDREGPDDD